MRAPLRNQRIEADRRNGWELHAAGSGWAAALTDVTCWLMATSSSPPARAVWLHACSNKAARKDC